MKPAPFAYHRAVSADHALSLLSELGDDAKILAGGQSLVPLLALRLTRFDHLIDINRAEDLFGVDAGAEEVTVGAMVRQAALTGPSDVTAAVPLLPAATRHIGHFQIRNRGTLGGSLSHGDPAAEYPAVALALDARMNLRSQRGSRAVSTAEFFVSTFVTSVQPDELLESVTFPVWGPGSGFAVHEAARRVGDFAIAGSAAGLQADRSGRVVRAAVALFGMGSTPVRATGAESALVGRTALELGQGALAEVARLAVHDVDAPSDIHASSAYRSVVGAAMVERALTDALGTAIGEGGR
ncbi:MAG TPA: FAD binding domain-containing protein [Acidimicrobiales bacterium]|nr:FAD binding domain-containing protein [Acidimicrobiales bacterium]